MLGLVTCFNDVSLCVKWFVRPLDSTKDIISSAHRLSMPLIST